MCECAIDAVTLPYSYSQLMREMEENRKAAEKVAAEKTKKRLA